MTIKPSALAKPSLLKSVLCFALLVWFTGCGSDSRHSSTDRNHIEGVVTGPDGPEAGVWVIAETFDLPTRYAKIVVTNDEGKYLIPDLPPAKYSVWVRGYGLVDSQKKEARPGSKVDHNAVNAPNAAAAAQYYPAGYWFSLLEVPDKSKFPGSDKNGISSNIKVQADFLRNVKSGTCLACHALGTKGTREFQASLGKFNSSVEAWERRLQSGQAGGIMISALHGIGRDEMLKMLADWTDRIAQGEVPEAPPRPNGIERNVVITQWDWADPKVYLHDVVSTDRRNPRVNANGPVYGALEASADYLPVLDPISHDTTRVGLTMRDPNTPLASGPHMPQRSPYWGDEPIWKSQANVHNPMIDEQGRVWITAAVRSPENPDFCKEGSDHPSAKVFPRERAGRHLAVYDPKTKKYTHISTCFSTHHLMFAEDENNTLWTSGGGEVVGWLDTRKWNETGDEKNSQGWTPLILDTNGNGKRDKYNEPDQPVDPALDHRISTGLYAVSPAPDGSVWGSSLGYPGALIRLNPGSNPTESALVEYYELPIDKEGNPVEGFSPRGMDVDRNGVAWVALASGHMASFDRKKCKNPLNGPNATGQHCPEGWTFYTEPLPQFKNLKTSGSAESS